MPNPLLGTRLVLDSAGDGLGTALSEAELITLKSLVTGASTVFVKSVTVDMSAEGATTILTVGTGKRFVPLGVTVECTSGTPSTAAVVAVSGLMPSTTLDGIDQPGMAFRYVVGSLFRTFAAGESIQISVGTAAAYTAKVYLEGYYA